MIDEGFVWAAYNKGSINREATHCRTGSNRVRSGCKRPTLHPRRVPQLATDPRATAKRMQRVPEIQPSGRNQHACDQWRLHADPTLLEAQLLQATALVPTQATDLPIVPEGRRARIKKRASRCAG